MMCVRCTLRGPVRMTPSHRLSGHPFTHMPLNVTPNALLSLPVIRHRSSTCPPYDADATGGAQVGCSWTTRLAGHSERHSTACHLLFCRLGDVIDQPPADTRERLQMASQINLRAHQRYSSVLPSAAAVTTQSAPSPPESVQCENL